MEYEALSSSLEDYLEAIYLVEQENKAVRPKDIVRRMGVGNSSVTRALQVLNEREMIRYAPHDFVSLTEQGRKKAQSLVERHNTLEEFFSFCLGINGSEASELACKMEHILTETASVRFAEFVRRIRSLDSAHSPVL